jgi:2-polyprenyl-6-methoxyphenol hydroxylase-like FAD-dependent oxidoreductase
MKPAYDVVIVGARVAGSATALLLARLGYRVLLLDRNHPSTDTLSTHAVMRTGVLQLQRWGVLPRVVGRGTPPIRQLTLGFGENRIRFDFRVEHEVDALYAPRRPVLDMALLEAALEAGVEFRQGQRVVDLTFDSSGQVTGVVVHDGKRQRTLTARFVVGADGRRSTVASLVGTASYETHPPVNVMTYGYFADVADSHYLSQFTPGSVVGYFPTNDDLTVVFASRPIAQGIFTDEGEFQQMMDDSWPEMGERIRAAERVGRFYHSVGIPGFLRVPGGRGWALVGDAGFTKDPLSSRGISDAFRDAELLAREIDAVLNKGKGDELAMADYQATRDRFAIPLLRVSQTLACFEWDAEEASALLRKLSKIIDEECRFLSQISWLTDKSETLTAESTEDAEIFSGSTSALSALRG